LKASEFVRFYAPKGVTAWEAAALDLAKSNQSLSWPTTTLHLSSGPHTAELEVQNDYFAIGEPDDFLRLPLTPKKAQQVANLGGWLLPTPKIAYEIWKQAAVKLKPIFLRNKYINLTQYAEHDQAIRGQLAALGNPEGLVTSHKKDVVVSNIYKPKTVLIYGWWWPVKPPGGGGIYSSQPIQGRSNVHDDGYADYSHGIRLVSGEMLVDGKQMRTEDVYRDKELSRLVSDEGPLRLVRYPTPEEPQPYTKPSQKTAEALVPGPSYADYGAEVMSERYRQGKL